MKNKMTKRIVQEKPPYERITREVVHCIRAWRNHRKLTMEQLAELSGISAAMISSLERGKSAYTQSTLEKLAKALQVQPWQLLACEPDNDRELWNLVLSRGQNARTWSDFPPEERGRVEVLLNSMCDFAMSFVHNKAASSS